MSPATESSSPGSFDWGGSEPFWSAGQPGFRFTEEPVGSPAFFAAVERHRYTLEPHIPEVVGFGDWAERDVLEVGCGIATDGLQFLRAGARYTGFDQSPVALSLAQRRFELEGLEARDLVQSTAVELPFADESFDLVFSHGVIHHIADTEGVVAEFRRVLRPGGTALVMVYHRDSFNYYVSIMGLRRALAALLLIPGAPRVIARATGESEELLLDHRALLRTHGLDYLRDRELFLAHNTDGPGNPLSKVYSRTELRELLADFGTVDLAVRHLNLRVLPGGGAMAEWAIADALGRRAGWHLYARALKPAR